MVLLHQPHPRHLHHLKLRGLRKKEKYFFNFFVSPSSLYIWGSDPPKPLRTIFSNEIKEPLSTSSLTLECEFLWFKNSFAEGLSFLRHPTQQSRRREVFFHSIDAAIKLYFQNMSPFLSNPLDIWLHWRMFSSPSSTRF